MSPEQQVRTLYLVPSLSRIDARSCAIAYHAKFGESIDWHEFSYFLDNLRNIGYLLHASFTNSGMEIYHMPGRAG